MSGPRTRCLWLLLAVLLGGCAGLQRQPPPLDFRLELEAGAIPELPRQDGILRIARPEAVAGTDTRRIAYRLQPHQLRYYTRSRWIDSPARMLGTVLAGGFEASGLFRAVTDDGTLPADYLLKTQLLRLEQQLPPDGPGTVQLQLRMQLIELPARHLLVSRLIRVDSPSPSRDAAGAVAGAQAALEKAVAEAIRTTAAALETTERRG